MQRSTHLIVSTPAGVTCTMNKSLHRDGVLLPRREGEAEATWPRCDRYPRDPYRVARRQIAKAIDRTRTVRGKLIGSLLEDTPHARRLIAAEPLAYAIKRVNPTAEIA